MKKFLPALLLIASVLSGGNVGYGSADGTGSAAQFSFPSDAAVDSAGNIYVADSGNSTIRKITPTGEVSTLAGLAGSYGSTDGTGSAAQFSSPSGVAVDSAGNVYVADTGNDTIRQITPTGDVSTLAGLAGSYGSADGTGSAAQFSSPSGVAVDSAGDLYVADTGNNTIRKISPTGDVSTLAGLAGSYGTGSPVQFNSPSGVAVDSARNVYVADSGNNTIRKITPAGVSTLVGLAGGAYGTGGAAQFNGPPDVAVGSTGNVDAAVAAQFNGPPDAAVGSTGNVDAADTSNNNIRVGTQPVQLLSAVLRKTDGSAGTFDVNLAETGAPGIKRRTGGATNNYTTVFTFPNTLTSVGGASVTTGTGTVSSSAIGSDAHQYMVNLTGVTSAQRLSVTLNNVKDASGDFSNSIGAVMDVPVGDTSAEGSVNSADISQTKAQSGATTTSSSLREEANIDGFLHSGDTSSVKSKSGGSSP